MKLLIATRADEAIKDMTEITHPVIKLFADRWGADFLQIDSAADCEGNGRFHYRIMDFYDLYDDYNRILSLDSDILLAPNCPNLFEMVAEECIGTTFEDKGTRRANRHKRISEAQKKFGNVGWTEGYINTGVFLTSKQHREIFTKIDGEYWTDLGFDDVHLGYQIRRFGFKVKELSFKFNHMTMFSEPWNGSPDRFDSYIIHYAGVGVFEKGLDRVEQIKKDHDRLWAT